MPTDAAVSEPSPPAAVSPALSKPRALARWRYWPIATAAVLVLLGGLVNFLYILPGCPLDLSGDEAHYWEWSRRLDLSYYSKGPLVAYIIAASRHFLADWSMRVAGSEVLAVRVPAVLLSVLTGFGLLTLAWLTTRNAVVVLLTMVLSATVPILGAGAVLMTIDAPLAFAWTWGLVFAWLGLRSRRRWWAWLVLSLLIAIGLLAKYNMLLIFPAVGLLILTQRGFLFWRLRPEPYLFTLLGLCGLLPILVWNLQHDWVSFRHVAGQAGVAGGPSINLLSPLEYLAGQALMMNPVWCVLLVTAAYRFAKAPHLPGENHHESATPFLLFTTGTPFAVFFCFSFVTKIQPNWPVIGLLPGVILMAMGAQRFWRVAKPQVRRRLVVTAAAGLMLGGGMSFLARRSDLLVPVFAYLARDAAPWEATPVAKFDPASRLRGWSLLGERVGEVLEAERARGRDPLILTNHYQVASLLAFYTPGHPNVYSLQAALGGRLSQYDLWENPIRDREKFVGRPCLYVGVSRDDLTGEKGGKEVLVNMQRVDTVEYAMDGHAIQIWPIFTCDAFAGFEGSIQQLPVRY